MKTQVLHLEGNEELNIGLSLGSSRTLSFRVLYWILLHIISYLLNVPYRLHTTLVGPLVHVLT